MRARVLLRLESRQSFRLTKMLTRNNDIDRRIKTGKEFESLMPEGATPFTEQMLALVRRAALAPSALRPQHPALSPPHPQAPALRPPPLGPHPGPRPPELADARAGMATPP